MLEGHIRDLHSTGHITEAATAAIEGYGPELLGFLNAIVRNPSDADEVFAMTCLDLWNGIRDFRFECSFRTWAYSLARHAYARYCRKDPRRRELPISHIPSLARLEARIRTSTRPYLRTDIKDRIARLRDQLAPEEQMLLVLRIDRDLSWGEVAQIMATSDGAGAGGFEIDKVAAACRKRFERTTTKLRRLAVEQGLLPET